MTPGGSIAATPEGRSTGGDGSIPLFESVPWAPLWIWLAISSTWLVLYLVYAHALLGSAILTTGFWLGWGLTNIQDALLIGYLPAATVWARRQGARTLRNLRPALVCSDPEFARLHEEVQRFERRPLVLGCLLAVAFGLGISLFTWHVVLTDAELASDLLARLGIEPGSGVVRGVAVSESIVFVVVAWLVWIFGYAEVDLCRRVSRIGADRTRVDLADLAPLRPFTELGLGCALRVIGVAVVASVGLLVIAEDVPVLGALAAAPILASLALLGPVRGVRGRIEEHKRAGLARARAEIRSLCRSDADAPPGRLADWIAYEARLESIQPWLYDRSGLVRFGIIVGAGMSMIGGALVERLVDALL